MARVSSITHISLPLLPLYAAVPLVVFIICRSLLRAAFASNKKVPGPFWARLSRLWYLSSVWGRGFEKVNLALHQRHGPVVRIAPGQYSIDDPEAIRTIYGHGTKFTKAPWYKAFGGPAYAGDLFTEMNERRHDATRRKVASLYSMSNLVQFEPFVSDCSELLMSQLKKLALSGQSINFQHWLQCYAFDAIGVITFDRRFGFLEEGEDKGGMFTALHQFQIWAANVGIYHEWHYYLHLLSEYLPGSGGKYLIGFSQQQLDEHIMEAQEDKEAFAARKSFLAKALQMHWKNPDNVTMTDVFVTAITSVAAGSDTTSVSLAGIMYHLIGSPEAYSKLRQEIDSATTQGKASNPVTFAESQAMPYLQACIKEGLRLHPATGLPLMRIVPAGGATIAGQYFPEGTTVGINTWVAHYNKSVFGEDAASFKPERWLGNKEAVSKMDQYYFPFGLGSRTCTGKNISLMEISKLIPELIRHFDFSLLHPDRKLETENVWFVKQKNMFCNVSLRKY